MRILFLVRQLVHGGAERQLVLLAAKLRARGHDVCVLTFYGGQAFEDELRAAGVDLRCLDKAGRWDMASFLARLVRTVRAWSPDVVHGYLPVPNILLGVLKPALGGCRVVWGIRASDIDLSHYDSRLMRLEYTVQARLSFAADLIIANSEAGRRYVRGQGFPTARVVVVPNGVDTDRFAPDPAGGAVVRRDLGVPDDARLVGVVGRLESLKGQDVLMRAIGRLGDRHSDVRWLCVGPSQDGDFRKTVERLAAEGGFADRLILSPPRLDTPALYAAMSFLCSPSLSEGFPNVVAEAMACARPVVTTDAGDSGAVLGECGRVVTPGDDVALSAALDDMLGQTAQALDALGAAARQRVEDRYHCDLLPERTEAVLAPLLR